MHNRTPRTHSFLLAALLTGCTAVAAPAWGQVIHEDIKLLAKDGAPLDQFGQSIAIVNGVVAVGAIRDNDNGQESGSAYLFDASSGVQICKLIPSDGAVGDHFGISIAIDDGVLAIGAWKDDDNGPESGSAYLFNASTGGQIAKLLPSDGDVYDLFGISIAIDNVVVVGASRDDDNGTDSGSAYLFDGATGALLAKLLPNDGAEYDEFGYSIAIANGVVAVGARFDGDNGDLSGSAYLFDISDPKNPVQTAKLLPIDGAAGDWFGFSVAVDDGVVAVGSYNDDDHGSASGSAYLFNVSTGAQIAKLLPTDGAAGDFFGFSIAIDDGFVAVGAVGDEANGPLSGSAYVFDVSSGAQLAKLLASDVGPNDFFGRTIAIDNGIVATGARGDDDNGSLSGSAYVFTVPGADCPADITGDGVVNAADLAQLLGAWGPNPGHPADFNGDDVVNAADLATMLGAWGPCEP